MLELSSWKLFWIPCVYHLETSHCFVAIVIPDRDKNQNSLRCILVFHMRIHTHTLHICSIWQQYFKGKRSLNQYLKKNKKDFGSQLAKLNGKDFHKSMNPLTHTKTLNSIQVWISAVLRTGWGVGAPSDTPVWPITTWKKSGPLKTTMPQTVQSSRQKSTSWRLCSRSARAAHCCIQPPAEERV